MLSTLYTEPMQPAALPMPDQIKVLLLDDSDFDRNRIRRMSSKTELPILMDEAASIEEMECAVSTEKYDVILMDYRLPIGSGFDALSCIQSYDLNQYAAKIMISGAGQMQTAIQALQGGCHDFLRKDELDPERLQIAMTDAILTAQRRYVADMKTKQQCEMLENGLSSALLNQSVQATFAELIRTELEQHHTVVALNDKPALPYVTRTLFDEIDHQKTLDALLVRVTDAGPVIH